ncbi:MAG TPA: rhodanese-like domain-containing protein [Candidatus Aphodousia faecavium]|uniref:Rhodanese-like domain-containing protein n=1 Tax=Parasutterella secunda TaxID=626947 RepID=A0ABS2GQR0_9BURK|nr:rhodanese-like domain-containing protein [Parasutterella secunda]HIT96532.1 rhodanese-like domain-containing protein [Candidatus Aphodousia faecavium]
MFEFLLDNILLVAVVFISGAFLLEPYVRKRSMGPSLNNEEVIDYINKKNAFVLDVRASKDFKRGAIAGSKSIPIDGFEGRVNEVPKDRPVIVVDTVTTSSVKAAKILRAQGYKDVFVLEGGIKGWVDAKLPFTR